MCIFVIGILLIMVVLVIVIVVFNGIELMVEKLYSVYDVLVMVCLVKGKIFEDDFFFIVCILKVEGVLCVSCVIEEMVILKNEKKWVNVWMMGIDLNYLEMCDINYYFVDGYLLFIENDCFCGIIGVVLLDNLNGWILD